MMLFKRKTLKIEAAREARVPTAQELDAVAAGRLVGSDNGVVIVGCTTRPPLGGYPPGTITWNPWIGQPHA